MNISKPLLGFLVVVSLTTLSSLVAPARAHEPSDLTAQGARQLDLAWKDLAAGSPERASNSASSALRLDPLLFDALLVKGLAEEQLGNAIRAHAFVLVYRELKQGIGEHEETEEALARLQAAVESNGGPMAIRKPDFSFQRVGEDEVKQVAAGLSGTSPGDGIQSEGFQLSYVIDAPSGSSEHTWHWPDQGFYVRIDRGGELKVRGKGMKTSKELGEDSWREGKKEEPNKVHIRFDGTYVSVSVNGDTFGPWDPSDGDGFEQPFGPDAEWRLTLKDSTITDLKVARFTGKLKPD